MKCEPISRQVCFGSKNPYNTGLLNVMREMREYNRIYNQAFIDGIMDIFGRRTRSIKDFSNTINKINKKNTSKMDSEGIAHSWQAVGNAIRKALGFQ